MSTMMPPDAAAALPVPIIHSTVIPPYLFALTQLLFGLTAVTRSKLIATVAVAYGLYYVLAFMMYPPEGEYLSSYMAATGLFGVVARTLWAVFLQDGNDFTRKSKVKKDDGHAKDGKDVKRGKIETVLDSLEVGFVAARGVGWNFEFRVQTTAPSANTPRIKFILTNLFDAAIHLILVDIASFYIRHYTAIGTMPVTRLLTDEPLRIAIPHAWLLYLMGRWSMDAYYRFASILGVASGIWGPADWPPIFGSFKDAYTIRRFWGYTWHQLMRSTAQPPTAFLAKKLGLPKNSRVTFYFKAAGAFFWAYALHAFGTHAAGGDHMADVWRYAPQVLLFFVEEEVVKLAQRLGVKGGAWARVAGYVWVAIAQGMTLVWWYGPMSKGGVFAEPPPSTKMFSPSDWIAARLT